MSGVRGQRDVKQRHAFDGPLSEKQISTNDTDRARVGLCADCQHARRIESSRGSVFYMCLRADRDPTFRKYPQLPVSSCAGYERKQT